VINTAVRAFVRLPLEMEPVPDFSIDLSRDEIVRPPKGQAVIQEESSVGNHVEWGSPSAACYDSSSLSRLHQSRFAGPSVQGFKRAD
jgi:hypothetical protein